MADALTRTPNRRRDLIVACANDFGRLMYDGLGIMADDQQLEAYAAIGQPGPRRKGESKYNWLSGGQRGGKTVLAAGTHIDAALYKRGVDPTDRTFWANYLYGTLAIAPSTELTLRLWTIMDSIAKGSHEAQYDTKTRRSRGGAFIGMFKAGKADQWPIVRYGNGAVTDFRSSEGYATRLEGGQWWWVTWDEWASQPDREIQFVLSDVLLGRARDHDAKIMPMAWPKPETERHLIAVIRAIETGRDRDSKVIYLDASRAFFTNQEALRVELRTKSKAQIERTIRGRPAGGAGIEFKDWMVEHMVRDDLTWPVPPEPGYGYLDSWDLGLGHDSTIGLTWRIPIVNGRRMVTPDFRTRIVDAVAIPGGPSLSPDTITAAIAKQAHYYHAEVAVDATGMGGLSAVRQLRDMNPRPYSFVSRSNDRLWGNMRLAAITNGLDLLTWNHVDGREDIPWGLIEMPRITPLLDQLFSFDRDDKNVPDDWVWSFLIGAWYIRRLWAVGDGKLHDSVPFDVRPAVDTRAVDVIISRRKRGRLISPVMGGLSGPAVAPRGQVFITDGRRNRER